MTQAKDNGASQGATHEVRGQRAEPDATTSPAGAPFDVRAVQRAIKDRYKADPSASRVTLRASASAHPETASPFLCEIEARRNRYESAAHEAIGITHAAPCSGELLLGALAACAQTSVQVIANAMKIPLEKVAVYAEGDLDFRGTLGMSRETAVGFTAIRVRYEVDAPTVSPEQLRSLHEKVERYCIIQQTLVNAPHMSSEWVQATNLATLHQFVFSCSCEKVRRALHHKGATWRTVEVDWFERSSLLELTGQSLAPVFVHGGQTLGPTSMQILDYIERAFPDGPTLFPGDSWAFCHLINEYVERILLPLAQRAFFPAAARAIQRDRFRDDVLRITGKRVEELDAELTQTATAYEPHLRYFEGLLETRRYLAGDTLSAADHILFSNLWFATNNPEFRILVDGFGLTHLASWEARMKDDFFTKIPF